MMPPHQSHPKEKKYNRKLIESNSYSWKFIKSFICNFATILLKRWCVNGCARWFENISHLCLLANWLNMAIYTQTLLFKSPRYFAWDGWLFWKYIYIYISHLGMSCNIAVFENICLISAFNSTPSGVAYIRRWIGNHRFGSWLVTPSAPVHYLNQWWLPINRT